MPDSASPSPHDSASDESVMKQEGIVRNISLDEFNPSGTLAITGLYFVLLLVLYALMYFVEFAGRGVSIIG